MIRRKGFAMIAAAAAAAAVVLGVSACGCSKAENCKGNETTEQADGENAKKEETLCGGYTQMRALSAEETELFKSVAGDGLTPLSVATQVVAGINYKFLCEGNGQRWIVVIYKPLPGHGEPTITSKELE